VIASGGVVDSGVVVDAPSLEPDTSPGTTDTRPPAEPDMRTTADAYPDAAVPFGSFKATGNMTTARYQHTATLLSNGNVLIVGGVGETWSQGLPSYNPMASAELYDPTAGTFTATGSMAAARVNHTATLLSNGTRTDTVLITGGTNNYDTFFPILASAELYDPAAWKFTAIGSMTARRSSHTATLLPNGQVLIAGGDNTDSGVLTSAELYDPSTGTFAATGNMTVGRAGHTATLLGNGKVLVVGGWNSVAGHSVNLASAELYDPAAGTFTATGNMTFAVAFSTATLLGNGKVLIASTEGTANLYDPLTGTFAFAGLMANTVRGANFATSLLPSGQVLITGGSGIYTTLPDSKIVAGTEQYDPVAGKFTTAGNMTTGREQHTATLLDNGKVLVVGGLGFQQMNEVYLASAEVYQ
jgi:hypothetical protein